MSSSEFVWEYGLANLPPGHQGCVEAKRTVKIPHLGDTRTCKRLYPCYRKH